MTIILDATFLLEVIITWRSHTFIKAGFETEIGECAEVYEFWP